MCRDSWALQESGHIGLIPENDPLCCKSWAGGKAPRPLIVSVRWAKRFRHRTQLHSCRGQLPHGLVCADYNHKRMSCGMARTASWNLA
jgi:hypothetical protein